MHVFGTKETHVQELVHVHPTPLWEFHRQSGLLHQRHGPVHQLLVHPPHPAGHVSRHVHPDRHSLAMEKLAVPQPGLLIVVTVLALCLLLLLLKACHWGSEFTSLGAQTSSLFDLFSSFPRGQKLAEVQTVPLTQKMRDCIHGPDLKHSYTIPCQKSKFAGGQTRN